MKMYKYLLIFLVVGLNACNLPTQNTNGGATPVISTVPSETSIPTNIPSTNTPVLEPSPTPVEIIATPTARPLPIYADLQLRTEFGNIEENDVVTGGEIYAVWWDKSYDLYNDALEIINVLEKVREGSYLTGLADPPNPGEGYYYNIYLHTSEAGKDNYPDGWANGQGTDTYSMPFLTLPIGYHLNTINLHHEGFHIFQYDSNSPGFDYSNDKGWYIEASASWYAAQKNPDDVEAFLETGSIYALPHQKLWRSWWNPEPETPDNWQRSVRQYGLSSLLYYLSEVEGVAASTFGRGFYVNSFYRPQEYLYRHIENYQEYFGNWAAHNAADFDYISRLQYDRMIYNLNEYADPDDIFPYAAIFPATGTDGEWYTPDPNLLPRDWAYNILQVDANESATWLVEFEGDVVNSSETSYAFFEARVVVKNGDAFTFHSIPLIDGLSGSFEFQTDQTDELIYIVIAAVPENFSGDQYYPYKIKIGKK